MAAISASPSWQSKFFGVPEFSLALSVDVAGSGRAQLRGHAYINPYLGMRSLWSDNSSLLSDEPIDLDPTHALQFLCDHWLEIAGPFVQGGTETAKLDLSGLFATPPRPVIMSRTGLFIGFDFNPLVTDMSSSSVIVIECLLQLGDLLADIVKTGTAVHAWRQFRAVTDLAPFGAEIEFGRYELNEEINYYSKHLGLSQDDYVRWAVWVHANHLLWAYRDSEAKLRPEPLDTFLAAPTELPSDLPLKADVDALVAAAAEEAGCSAERIVEDALHSRNSDARQIVVYRRWYGNDRRDTATGFTGVLAGTVSGELKDNDLSRFNPSGSKSVIPVELTPHADPRDYVRSGRPLELKGALEFLDGKPVRLRATEVDVDHSRETIARIIRNNSVLDD
jgi:hypothetical protein